MKQSELSGAPRGDAAAEQGLADAVWLYQAFIRDLRAHHDKLRQRGDACDVSDADLRRAADHARSVRQAIQLMMEERGKVEKFRVQIAGAAGGGLDLAAARDEIGRRLACLRRAGSD